MEAIEMPEITARISEETLKSLTECAAAQGKANEILAYEIITKAVNAPELEDGIET